MRQAAGSTCDVSVASSGLSRGARRRGWALFACANRALDALASVRNQPWQSAAWVLSGAGAQCRCDQRAQAAWVPAEGRTVCPETTNVMFDGQVSARDLPRQPAGWCRIGARCACPDQQVQCVLCGRSAREQASWVGAHLVPEKRLPPTRGISPAASHAGRSQCAHGPCDRNRCQHVGRLRCRDGRVVRRALYRIAAGIIRSRCKLKPLERAQGVLHEPTVRGRTKRSTAADPTGRRRHNPTRNHK